MSAQIWVGLMRNLTHRIACIKEIRSVCLSLTIFVSLGTGTWIKVKKVFILYRLFLYQFGKPDFSCILVILKVKFSSFFSLFSNQSSFLQRKMYVPPLASNGYIKSQEVSLNISSLRAPVLNNFSCFQNKIYASVKGQDHS